MELALVNLSKTTDARSRNFVVFEKCTRAYYHQIEREIMEITILIELSGVQYGLKS